MRKTSLDTGLAANGCDTFPEDTRIILVPQQTAPKSRTVV